MHVVQFRIRKSLIDVPELIRIHVEIVIGDDPTDKLAVQVVVCDIDCPDAPIGVGFGVGTGTKGPICKSINIRFRTIFSFPTKFLTKLQPS